MKQITKSELYNGLKIQNINPATPVEYRDALKGLHRLFGLDFEGEIGIAYQKGPATWQRLVREARGLGYDPVIHGDLVCILRVAIRYWRADQSNQVITISGDGKIDVGYRPYYCEALDNYGAKKYAEAARKDERTSFYLIWQQPADRKPPRETDIGWSARYKLFADGLYPLDYTDGKRFIGLWSLAPSYRRRDKSENELDKSGYLVGHRRNELKRTAAKRRAEKEKAAADAADHAAEMEALEAEIARVQKLVNFILANAATSRDYEILTEAIGGPWRGGLAGAVKERDRIKARIAECRYSSLEDYRRDYDEAMRYLSDARRTITGEAA